jgi:hypothetical protein
VPSDVLVERSAIRAQWARPAAGIAFGLLAAVGVGMGIWVIVESYSPVPYADFWGQLAFIERAYGGDLRLSDFWVQANEHRIFVPRIQFLIEYRLFGGTYAFLFTAIAISSLLLAATFATVAWLETRDRLLAWGTLCVAAIATLSPAGRENLWWAFQVQFVQVFLFATLAVLAVVVAARSGSSRGRTAFTAAAGLAAVAASYSMANGLLVWPVILVLAVVLRLGLRPTFALGLTGAATYATYLWHAETTGQGGVSDVPRLFAYTLVYLGSVLWDVGHPREAAGVLGGVGVALFGLLCVLAWKRRARGSVAMPFAAGTALFVLLSAFQTAVGRIDLGVAQALSSRYTIASFTFWLALLVGFLAPLRERFGRRARILAPAYLAAAAAASLLIGLIGLPSRTFLRTEVVGKETAVLAYLVGVDDPSGTKTGVPSGEVVANAFRWMEANGLGPWAPGGMVEGMRLTVPPASGHPPCPGAIEHVDPVGGGFRLTGWIAPLATFEPLRNLAVFDQRGMPRGIGRVGTHRPDVASSDWTGFVAYARGDPEPPLAVVLIGDDRRSAVCRLERR